MVSLDVGSLVANVSTGSVPISAGTFAPKWLGGSPLCVSLASVTALWSVAPAVACGGIDCPAPSSPCRSRNGMAVLDRPELPVAGFPLSLLSNALEVSDSFAAGVDADVASDMVRDATGSSDLPLVVVESAAPAILLSIEDWPGTLPVSAEGQLTRCSKAGPVIWHTGLLSRFTTHIRI